MKNFAIIPQKIKIINQNWGALAKTLGNIKEINIKVVLIL